MRENRKGSRVDIVEICKYNIYVCITIYACIIECASITNSAESHSMNGRFAEDN